MKKFKDSVKVTLKDIIEAKIINKRWTGAHVSVTKETGKSAKAENEKRRQAKRKELGIENVEESQELQAKMALDDAGIPWSMKRNRITVKKKDKKKAQLAWEKSFKKGGWPSLNVEDNSPVIENMQMCEGTWALPDSPKKMNELKKLLKRKLPAKDATKKLYNLVGNDELFDLIGEIRKAEGPNADVSDAVKFWLASHQEFGFKEDIEYTSPEEINELLNTNEEVFTHHIVQGTTEKGKIAHTGTLKQMQKKIKDPKMGSNHVLVKTRHDLKTGDKWKKHHHAESNEVNELSKGLLNRAANTARDEAGHQRHVSKTADTNLDRKRAGYKAAKNDARAFKFGKAAEKK